MPLDKQVNVRLSRDQHDQLSTVGGRLASALGRKRVTVSHVVRLAVEDYLRRNA